MIACAKYWERLIALVERVVIDEGRFRMKVMFKSGFLHMYVKCAEYNK